MNMERFKQISFRGRVAYGVSCFENALISLKYVSEDWKIVLRYLWEFTNSSNLEDCHSATAELIPENLMETKIYDEDFERISEDEYLCLYRLYQNIDETIHILLRDIHELGISHTYTNISGYGERSVDSLQTLICHMLDYNYPLPSIEPFFKSSILEDDGWGYEFDGTKFSKIL
ncbi:hypothetical protein FC752_09795 [Lysinibacillus varians]|uniref:Uncharacterized protein n=2 Tax=Lysinibacillus varians TaxID=1145276 RepID=A0ABY2TBT5_9BACI|nr:hypothetical protein T479_14475 [Lysinibacillus varians]TKI65056.1 hypothetical protein FC752_09795 [Lysinibacillus varians]